MVLLMAEYPDFFLDLLYSDIIKCYLQRDFRMSAEEFEARKATLTQEEIDDYNTPGHFSKKWFYPYLEFFDSYFIGCLKN